MIFGNTIYVGTAAQAWWTVLRRLISESSVVNLGHMHSELIGTTLVLSDPKFSLITSPGRRFNYRTIIAEGLWNVSPRADIGFLERFNPNITRFVADQPEGQREHAHWAYGPHFHHQLSKAAQELAEHPDTRRARISIEHPYHLPGTPPCTTSVQWLIREGELHQIVNMRSNDAWLGVPLDIGQFSLWHRIMSAALGIPLGRYIHHAGSLHLYKHDLADALKVVELGADPVEAPAVGASALKEARTGAVLDMVDGIQHSAGLRPEMTIDYRNVIGLKHYAALLCGDYPQAGTFNKLRLEGHGRGWS